MKIMKELNLEVVGYEWEKESKERISGETILIHVKAEEKINGELVNSKIFKLISFGFGEYFQLYSDVLDEYGDEINNWNNDYSFLSSYVSEPEDLVCLNDLRLEINQYAKKIGLPDRLLECTLESGGSALTSKIMKKLYNDERDKCTHRKMTGRISEDNILTFKYNGYEKSYNLTEEMDDDELDECIFECEVDFNIECTKRVVSNISIDPIGETKENIISYLDNYASTYLNISRYLRK